MLPRLSDIPAPGLALCRVPDRAPAARLRGRSGAGLWRPGRLGDRQLDLPALPAGDRLPAHDRRPAAHRPRRRRGALPRPGVRAARRRDRHQRPVAHRRPGGGRVPPHEPHPRDQHRGALGARAGGRGQGPAQRRAGRARPVLPAGALHVQPRHHRRHDQHGCVRPGLVPLRQDPRPRARADHRAARRDGVDVRPARGGRAAPRAAPHRPGRRRPSAGRHGPARAGRASSPRISRS